jgi:hypothetical protein
MKFLPYERLKINTTLSSQEVLTRLDNVIEPRHFFRFFGTGKKPYEGKVEGVHFEVSRIIGYRNPFLPIIKGDIQTEISGCVTYISMQPHILVIVFSTFWLGCAGLLFLVSLASIISSFGQNSAIDPSLLLLSGGMFAFGYALLLGSFKFESAKSKKFFRELLGAKEVEEMGFAAPFNAAG